jgi:tRNA-Thr(GGU) m(6)t(6)A37 methyltransferase TsaA
MDEHHYPPIGVLKTCFTEKFGVPRQSLMISEARGILKLNPDPSYRAALNHLEQFSHLWVLFVFHQHAGKPWRPTIEPPRVDAPRRVGVFASRSPHRPNPIGLSAVRLERIDYEARDGIELHLSGVDILDGSPVLDIKPYLPFADRIPEANDGWASSEITRYPVTFSTESLSVIEKFSEQHPRLQSLVSQLLEWDPRPTSQRRSMPIEAPASEGMVFAFRILDFDVQWEIRSGAIWVRDLIVLARSKAE